MAWKIVENNQPNLGRSQQGSINPQEQQEESPIFPEQKQQVSQKPKKESAILTPTGQEFFRHAARQGKNLVGAVSGLPGTTLDFFNRIAAKPIYEAVTGKEGKSYEEMGISKLLPTIGETTEMINRFDPKYLEPRNDTEKFWDDVVVDTALLFTPTPSGKGNLLSNAARRIPPVLKNFATSLGINAIGKGAQEISGDEKLGSYAKMGSLLLSTLIDKKNGSELASALYSKARESIPEGAITNTRKLSADLQAIENNVLKGRPPNALSKSEKFVLDQIEKVKSSIKFDKSPFSNAEVDSLWAAKKTLNEELSEAVFNAPDKAARKGMRKYASTITKSLRETLNQYGKENPNFGKNFGPAEEAFGTIAQSNLISNFVNRNIKYNPITSGLLHIVGGNVGSIGSAAAIPKLAIPYQAAKLMYKIYKSPTLRKHYLKVMKAAGEESATIFNKELESLDKEVQKEEKKNPDKEGAWRVLD